MRLREVDENVTIRKAFMYSGMDKARRDMSKCQVCSILQHDIYRNIPQDYEKSIIFACVSY